LIRNKIRRLLGRVLNRAYMRLLWWRYETYVIHLAGGDYGRPISVEKVMTEEGWIFTLVCSEMHITDRFRRVHKIDVRDIKWKNGSYVQEK
jgi:hypothetical protein